jgi:hypothetical protein
MGHKGAYQTGGKAKPAGLHADFEGEPVIGSRELTADGKPVTDALWRAAMSTPLPRRARRARRKR